MKYQIRVRCWVPVFGNCSQAFPCFSYSCFLEKKQFQKPYPKRPQVLLLLLFSCFSDTGVMSVAMIFIKEDLKVNDTQISVLAGILNVCALVGSLAAGRTSDFLGGHYTIVLASIMFLVGSVLMGYDPNYPILLTGRCTSGVGVGYALMIAPVYSAEISSPKSRGFITSLPELGISTGILTAWL